MTDTPSPAPPRTVRANTRPRTIRIADEQWDHATAYAADNSTTVSQLVRDHFAALARRTTNTKDPAP